jgi:hypothetical protein
MRKKIIRNLASESGRAFWDSARKSAEGVRDWPDWKKAGVTAEQPGVVSIQLTPPAVDAAANHKR